MKKYTDPILEIVYLSDTDVITTSPGTETTPIEETDGVWGLDLM